MTEKADNILKKMRRKRLPFPVVNDKILAEFNQSTLDESGPVSGGDKEMKILTEMNELEEFQNENWSRGAV